MGDKVTYAPPAPPSLPASRLTLHSYIMSASEFQAQVRRRYGGLQVHSACPAAERTGGKDSPEDEFPGTGHQVLGLAGLLFPSSPFIRLCLSSSPLPPLHSRISPSLCVCLLLLLLVPRLFHSRSPVRRRSRPASVALNEGRGSQGVWLQGMRLSHSLTALVRRGIIGKSFLTRASRLSDLVSGIPAPHFPGTQLTRPVILVVSSSDDDQGSQLKIPYVEKRPLDLHALHTVVQDEGGFEICTRDRKWSNVATRMNYTISRHTKGPVASVLRQHYERLLFPYDVLMSGATIGSDGLTINPKSTTSPAPEVTRTGDLTTSCPAPDLKDPVVKMEATPDPSHQSEDPAPPATASPPAESSPAATEVKSEAGVKSRGRRRAGTREEDENEPERKMLRSSPRKNPGTIAGRRMQGLAVTRSRRSGPFCSLTSHTSPAQSSPAVNGVTSNNGIGGKMNLRSSKELKKLQVHGAGPKAPGIELSSCPSTPVSSSAVSSLLHRRPYNRRRRLITFSSYSSLSSHSVSLSPSSSKCVNDSPPLFDPVVEPVPLFHSVRKKLTSFLFFLTTGMCPVRR